MSKHYRELRKTTNIEIKNFTKAKIALEKTQAKSLMQTPFRMSKTSTRKSKEKRNPLNIALKTALKIDKVNKLQKRKFTIID